MTDTQYVGVFHCRSFEGVSSPTKENVYNALHLQSFPTSTVPGEASVGLQNVGEKGASHLVESAAHKEPTKEDLLSDSIP